MVPAGLRRPMLFNLHRAASKAINTTTCFPAGPCRRVHAGKSENLCFLIYRPHETGSFCNRRIRKRRLQVIDFKRVRPSAHKNKTALRWAVLFFSFGYRSGGITEFQNNETGFFIKSSVMKIQKEFPIWRIQENIITQCRTQKTGTS